MGILQVASNVTKDLLVPGNDAKNLIGVFVIQCNKVPILRKYTLVK